MVLYVIHFSNTEYEQYIIHVICNVRVVDIDSNRTRPQVADLEEVSCELK